MKPRQIIGTAVLGAAVAGFGILPGALAADHEVSYAAVAAGEALSLTVFGEQTTIGRTVAGLDSTLTASASGAGVASPLGDQGASTALADQDGSDGSDGESCATDIIDIPGVQIGFACSSSTAEVIDGIPHSSATGRVGRIIVNPVQAVSQTPLAALVPQGGNGVGTVLDALGPVSSGAAATSGLRVDNTLGDLFAELFGGADLVSIDLGITKATSSVANDVVTATCVSHGGRVDILDPVRDADGVDAPAVMSIVVGDAASAVGATTTDGVATPTYTPAIVTVFVPSLGIEQAVGVGEAVEIPLPEPLGTSRIAVADGSTELLDNGQTGARANAVFLDLLNGDAMMGGVEMSLASCTSVAGATVRPLESTSQVEPRNPPEVVPSVTPILPRTGGGSPDPIVLFGAFGLAAAGLSVLRRTGQGH